MIQQNILSVRLMILTVFQIILIATFSHGVLGQHCEPYWTAAYKCAMGCGPCGGGGSGGSGGGSRVESARSQQIDAANALYDKGWDAFQNGDWATALSFFQRAEAVFSYKGYRRGIAMANMELEWVKGHEAGERGDYEAELVYFQRS